MLIDPFAAGLAGAILFAAYVVRGIVGFSSGLIAVPLLALQLPLTTVVPIIVLLDYLGSAFQGAHNHHLVAWREEFSLIPFMIPGVALGLFILHETAPKLLAQALGALVIVYAVYQLLPVRQLQGSRLLAAPCGFLGGLIGTLFGTGGPFYVIYFGLRQLDNNVQRATTAINFLIDGGIRLAAFTYIGAFRSVPDLNYA